jgi:predicted transposase YdaD
MTDKKNNNTKDIGKPKYDAFFKFNLEKQEVAQAYIKQVVPQELANLSDFSNMQLEPSEHIDPELRKLITDVLWSVPFKDTESPCTGSTGDRLRLEVAVSSKDDWKITTQVV